MDSRKISVPVAATLGAAGPFHPDARLGELRVMREHQRHAYRALRDVPRSMLAWATGAGKTACALALAAHHADAGRLVVFAAPERALLDAYTRPFSMAVDDSGTEVVPFAGAVEPRDAKELRGWLRTRRGRPAAVVCTHSMLRAAVGRGLTPKDCFLVLDEAHHTRDTGDGAEGANVLGSVVRAFEGERVLCMSASPFRADELPLLPPDVLGTFEVSRFGLADLLADNGLEIVVRVVAGPLATAIETLCSRRTKARIVYLPSVNTAVSRAAGGKYAVRDAVAAATARWTDESVVDLVADDAGRSERVAALREGIAAGRTAKTSVALSLLREGWDAPETDDLVVLSAPKSLTLQTQLIGRVTRRPSASKTSASVTFCLPFAGDEPTDEEMESFLETLAGVLAIGVELEAGGYREGAGEAPKADVPERQKRIRRALLSAASGDESRQRREWAAMPEGERKELLQAFRVVVPDGEIDALGIHIYRAANGLISASMIVSSAALQAYANARDRRGWTSREDAIVRAGYAAKTTLGDIAAQIGRSVPAVQTRARAIGCAESRFGAEARLTEAVAFVIAGHSGVTAAARKFRLTQKHLSCRLRELGHEVRSNHDGSAGRLAEAVDSVIAGNGIVAASKTFGVNHKRLSARLRECGHEVRATKDGAGDRLAEAVAYVVAGRGGVEPARKRFGVAHTRLAAHLRELGYRLVGYGPGAKWVRSTSTAAEGESP